MSNVQKIVYVLSVTTLSVAIILVGCASNTKQKISADAKFDIVTYTYATSVHNNAVETLTETDNNVLIETIKHNEVIIASLKQQIKKPGIQFDNARLQKIEFLQIKNKALKNKVVQHQPTAAY